MSAEPIPAAPPVPTTDPLIGLAVFGLAILAGLAGDGLIRPTDAYLGMALWATLLALGVWAVAKRFGVGPAPVRLRLVTVAVGFAWLPVWRASETLAGLDTCAAFLALSLAALVPATRALRATGALEVVLSVFVAGLNLVFGGFGLVGNDVRWKELPRGGNLRQLFAVLRGLAIAIPLLVLFGGLLMAADAAFQGLMEQAFAIDAATIVEHTIVACGIAWAVGGGLHLLFFGQSQPLPEVKSFRLGIVEVALTLGLLDLLFLAFVAVQFRYFFGGAALIEATAGLSYADYARSGFFQLVTVVTLILPVLLALHATLEADRPRQRRLFTGLAGAMVGLITVILLSALLRMRLYGLEFGLTELRLYTTAFMGWLAFTLAWFCATVLRGRPGPFAFGAVVGGLALVVGLHLINPDGVIVRVNAARDTGKQAFDATYALSLSADAVPALLDCLPTLAPGHRSEVAKRLLLAYGGEVSGDWRSWNWGRPTARAQVESARRDLEAILGNKAP